MFEIDELKLEKHAIFIHKIVFNLLCTRTVRNMNLDSNI